jgi:hypothetical protein
MSVLLKATFRCMKHLCLHPNAKSGFKDNFTVHHRILTSDASSNLLTKLEDQIFYLFIGKR